MKLVRTRSGETKFSSLKQCILRIAHALRDVYSHKREVFYLDAFPPEKVQAQLQAIGLNQHWLFADFDEVMIEQSSQNLWAKLIVRKKKTSFPWIISKYIHYYKWRENLYELNKIFRYSDGIKELKGDVIPLLKLNKNAVRMLDILRKNKIDKAGTLRKFLYKFYQPAVSLVIVSSNTGTLLRLFLNREDIQKHLKDNKIILRAVVANKMGFDRKNNITGLDHEENIIDVNTKKDYIPKNNVVFVDKRDSHLKRSHPYAIFIPPGPTKTS